ncbi:MAG: ArnT family glycosyltransferase [Betaproteobacteria bacterium]
MIPRNVTEPPGAAPVDPGAARWRAAVGSFPLHVGVAAAGLLVLFLRTYPLTFWEYDELLFSAGVRRFQPLLHHPHPPGYPAYIGLGKAVHLFVGSPFASLVALSVLLSVVGFVALAAGFRNLLHDDWLGLAGALLFYLSPGMLVDATLPLSDAPAIGLFAVAIHQSSKARASGRREAALLGLFASLAIGCRPQLALMVLPFLIAVALRRQSVGDAGVLAAAFAVTSLAWFVPLLVATGGLSGFLRYEFAQASDFAAKDANLARSGWSWPALVLRFVAHPWGLKVLSIPILASAGVGLAAAVRRREAELAPLVVAGGLYLAIAVAAMDPADGVRYALPGTMVVALLASRGLAVAASWSRLRGNARVALACIAAAAVVSVWYVSPVVLQRHAEPSPPAQAAAYARDRMPHDAVILFDRSLMPHAQQLFPSFQSHPLGEGFGGFAERGDVPIVILADGASDAPGAVTFSWNDSDAYGKLTRNHYRVVSLIPVPQSRRYQAVRGVYAPERTVTGTEWRWLAPSARIVLPSLGATRLRLQFALPADYPWGSSGVTVRVGGGPIVSTSIRRGDAVAVSLRLPESSRMIPIDIDSERAYVPARVPGLLQRDQRVLGVMLRGLEQYR